MAHVERKLDIHYVMSTQFDFSDKFEVTSYKYLDKLLDAKKIDYSLEIV